MHKNKTLIITLACVFLLIINTKYIRGDKCVLNSSDQKPRYLHFQGQSLDFTLQTSNRISHRLVTEVLKILLKDCLGYQNIKIISDYNYANISYMFDSMFRPIQDAHIKIPNVMINLEVLITPETEYKKYLQIYPFSECGTVAPPGRYAFFIPKNLTNDYLYADHWRFFQNSSNMHIYDITNPDYIDLLKKNSYDIKANKYYCNEKFCSKGVYIPQQCKNLNENQYCAFLLTSYPESTSFVIQHIKELQLYVKVVWLGNNLKTVVETLTKKYKLNGAKESLIFLEWVPGYYTMNSDNFNTVLMPDCNRFKTTLASNCKYETTNVVKFAWSELQNIAKPAFEMVHKINFNINTYEDLLQYFDGFNTNITESAYKWMIKNKSIWNQWLPTNFDKPELFIGGIFPISGALYNAKGIILAAKMAQDAINKNTSILDDYKIKVLINDGKCRADMVMKTFIDYIFDNTYQNLLGILGPACSETVEPLAGISKHYSTLVISYSAEGSSFSDRSKYPYFFRTIGENSDYQQVYLQLFQSFGWNRIAALTEDGQKYTEYLSSMGDILQTSGITLITNLKFPRNSKESSLSRYLEDLKEKQAKIIIADAYDEVARIVMCLAYKLDMTAKQGYVWFLPSWLPTKWYNTTHFNKYFNENINCTIEMMLNAIDGHFSLKHATFASEDSIMQENISVGEWRKRYKNQVDDWFKSFAHHQFNPYTTLNDNDFTSDYAGYAYDAVWTYALATEELLKSRPESLSNIHSQSTTTNLVKIITDIDFNGVSGKIKFNRGPSRYSIIHITQWINKTNLIIGTFYPNASTSTSKTIEGNMILNQSAIIWLTQDGKIPDDGTMEPDKCLLEPLAKLLQISCNNTFVLINILCFGILGITLTIAVILLKKRYDEKIRNNEEMMKAISMYTNGGISLTNLDKWETPRECVVLNRKLGEGAFGTVYGGEALLSEGKGWIAVAVKTLKVGSNREEKLDFLSEAESMKRFDHKNIVKLLGVCTKNEPFYTIMEFMLYGDLKTFLLARRHLVYTEYSEEREEISNKKLTSMALDIARALCYLADLKYVHRDVACRNCLINAQRVIKLGDFGMTRLVFESDYYRFSRKGMLPVRWMAPESLGLGIFTSASDIWSYGVLLYEIITFGSFPFQGMSNNEVLLHVKNGNTLKIPSPVKPQLQSLMNSCWNQEFKARPNAREIIDFLMNNPRIISPCLDVPITSVELDFLYDLNILPETLSHHTIPELEEDESITEVTLLNSLHYDNPSYIETNANSTNPKNDTNTNNKLSIDIIDEETKPFI